MLRYDTSTTLQEDPTFDLDKVNINNHDHLSDLPKLHKNQMVI